MPQPEKSRDEAAKITGTNGKYVNAAAKIIETAPDIAATTDTGHSASIG